MPEVVPTNIIVPGRGHNILPNGTMQLSASAIQRVHTVAEYYLTHEDRFVRDLQDGTGGMIVMAGGYASLATGNKLQAPPFETRESTLMCGLARAVGIPADYLGNSPSSTSTLENILRAKEEGFFSGVGRENPLGIVTQESQWERLNWFARKVFKLPQESVVLIAAPGEDYEQIINDERKLMHITRIAYGIADTPKGPTTR
jgi:hypothetical protein